DVYWPADPQGVTHGWGDLALRPCDAAKIGFLYLHRGTWEGRQILATEWVAQATSSQTATDQQEGYGYGWWISAPSEEVGFFRADGNGGQHILVVPSRDLVVVTTGGGFSASALFSAVASGVEPLPANPAGVARLGTVVAELGRGPEPEPVPPLPGTAREISGRTYAFGPNPVGMRSLRLDFEDPAEAILRLDLASELMPRVDRVGLDGAFRPSLEGRPIVARGSWEGPRTFVVEVEEGPGFTAYDLRLRFTARALWLEVLGISLEARAEGHAP
ncbi:MAG TPA: hypothetical protein VE669_02405, partial [Actinomycetota bacterium]|nr:hypothetical protein [Actinomycetota bacterium]